jgi:hypothetical protein
MRPFFLIVLPRILVQKYQALKRASKEKPRYYMLDNTLGQKGGSLLKKALEKGPGWW